MGTVLQLQLLHKKSEWTLKWGRVLITMNTVILPLINLQYIFVFPNSDNIKNLILQSLPLYFHSVPTALVFLILFLNIIVHCKGSFYDHRHLARKLLTNSIHIYTIIYICVYWQLKKMVPTPCVYDHSTVAQIKVIHKYHI